MNTLLRLAAVTALYRQGAHGREFYIVHRSRQLPFLGGFHALPGGSVDAADHELAVAHARSRPAFVAAGIRELFEEAGVLLAVGAEHLTQAQRDDGRKAVLEHSQTFATFLDHHALMLDGEGLIPMGVWVTPPYSRTVFEAQYFAVGLPEGQTPSIWPGELDHGEWLTAPEALARHAMGELFLAYPVLKTLEAFAQPSTLTEICTQLARRDPRQPLIGAELLAGVQILPLLSPTLPPATRTNCYILGGPELVVVDPAPPEPAEQANLMQFVRALERQGRYVREIWLSHHHPDHMGAAAMLAHELQVGIAAHSETAEILAGKITVTRLIHDDEVMELSMLQGPKARWRALHTPGHARGHLCFYEERLHTLLSGDTVVTNGTVVVPPHEGGMRAYLASLRRLLQLELGFMLPSHGPPVALARERIQRYLDHRAAREQAIVRALSQPKTIEALALEIYAGLAPGAVKLAQINVAAHLDKLIEEAKVERKGDYFQITS